MRALIQRVSRAQVVVDGETIGAIDGGLLVLLGITHADEPEQAQWLAEKVASLRIFADDEGKMNRDVAEAGGAMLIVSQFTLYGDARKGRRPSFRRSVPDPTMPFRCMKHLSTRSRPWAFPTATGRFGAMMQVELINDGPVTLMVDSK